MGTASTAELALQAEVRQLRERIAELESERQSDRPNSRAARLTLIPSTCTARRTRTYTSTLSTSQVSQKHTSPVSLDWFCSGVVYYCSAVYSPVQPFFWERGGQAERNTPSGWQPAVSGR